ncbi:MAG: hypothetical protein M4579_004832 [Chaenotheca gracillima]|nr:MAG: hypothetical protein M4579_004832 [Chaenotheca gracillima]
MASERTPLLGDPSATRRLLRLPSSLEDAEESEVVVVEDDNSVQQLLQQAEYATAITGLEPTPPGASLSKTPEITAVVREWSVSSHDGSSLHDESHGQVMNLSGDTHARFLGGVSPKRFWMIFGTMMLNLFVGSFDSTLMASSHPVITSYFGASYSASWLSTAFLLTLTAFQPLFGRVSDTFGRRPLYLFTLVIFAVSTVWCAIAGSMISFILARAASGLGAGGVMAMGAFICNDLVPLEIRGLYQSYINLAYGMGAAAGAAFGGMLCDLIGWRWTFGIQVPLILTCLVAATLTTPRDLGPMLYKTSKRSTWETVRSFDFKGSICLTSSATCLILGLNLGGNILPWLHPLVILSLITFAVTAVCLVFVERKAEKPVLPMDLLISAPRANLIFCNFCSAAAVNTIIFNIPLFFQAVLQESPTLSGLRLVLPTIAASAAAVSAGFIITWTTRLKPTVVLGSVLILLGSICLSCLRREFPSWVPVLCIIPAVVGQGFVFPSTVMSVLATSTQEDQAVVSSAIMLWRSLGTVIGVATSSLILQNALNQYLRQLVTGPNKDHVIRQVRGSVRAIASLSKLHQDQVIHAYCLALRVTFMSAIVAGAVMVILVVPIKLPRLRKMHR